MARKTLPLSDTEIKTAKPLNDNGVFKDRKLFDGDGLFLLIKSNGNKWWRFKYRFENKEKLLSLGTYPEISLQAARKLKDEARSLIASGIDPSIKRQDKKSLIIKEQQAEINTLALIASEYFDTIKSGVSSGYLTKMQRRIEIDILPKLGDKNINSITHYELLDCIKLIENRGALVLSKRTLNYCESIWKFAVSLGKADFNITANIDKKTALAKIKKQNYPHITDIKELSILLHAIDSYNGDYSTKLALQLMPYVFVRPANIRFMEWHEIDFEKAIWSIPAEKMKMKTAHLVPLSKSAIKILNEAKIYNQTHKYVFSSAISSQKAMSENTLNYALIRLGYKDKMVSHGFRHTASTLLHENIHIHGISDLVIEAQLAHVERNSVKAAYNKAEYLPQRVKLMDWWSDYLDGLKN